MNGVPDGYPIFLDLSQRLIVIIGGGAVASRKAGGVLAAGARNVRAIAPAFSGEFSPVVQRVTESFAPGHLEGAGLVFAATDSPQVNRAVVEEARRRGVLVNRADADEEGQADFSTPALLRCGSITVAVSANGSPALAANVRDVLAGAITDEWVNLSDVTGRLRPIIKSGSLPIERQREIFRSLASPQAASILAAGGEAGLLLWARQQFSDFPVVKAPGEAP